MKDYYQSMVYYENECNSYILKAEAVLEENGGKHSKDECRFLQKAIQCQAEMANLSVGDEKLYHKRRIKELEKQLLDAIREFDPEAYQRYVNKGQGKKAGSADAPAASPAKQEEQVDTTGWFCDMPSHSFQDVAGMGELKEYLKKRLNITEFAQVREHLGLPNLHSFFFYGPPGCGKTFVVEAFIHELMAEKDYKYLSLQGSDILSKYVGDAEKTVKKLFMLAEENAPCIVFIDEIDGVCKNRSLPNLPEYASSITTSFLTGYNMIQKTKKPIIFIGATNYPGQVDHAMLDRVELIRVDLPDKEHRRFIFENRFQKRIKQEDDTVLTEDRIKLAPGLKLDYMADRTNGYDVRDMSRLIDKLFFELSTRAMNQYENQEDAIKALKDGSLTLDKALFDAEIKKHKPTPKEGLLKVLNQWEQMMKSGEEEQEEEAVQDPRQLMNQCLAVLSAQVAKLNESLEKLSAGGIRPAAPDSQTDQKDAEASDAGKGEFVQGGTKEEEKTDSGEPTQNEKAYADDADPELAKFMNLSLEGDDVFSLDD